MGLLKRKRRRIFTIAFSHYVHDVYSAFFAPVLPLLVSKLGISYTSVGLLQVIQRSPSFLMPFIGILAEKVALRFFVIWSPAITAITMSLLGVVPNIWFLMVLLVIMGAASALYHVPAPVMLKQITTHKLGFATSMYMLAGELARTSGPMIILGAISILTFEGTWLLMFFGIFSSLFLHFRLKDIAVSQAIKKSPSIGQIKQTFKAHTNLFIVIFFIMMFRAMIKTSLSTFLTIYLTENGQTLLLAGIGLTILQAAGAVGTLLSGTLSDFIGRKKIIVVTTVLAPIFMYGFLLTDGFLQTVFLILVGFVIFASGPVFMALVLNASKKNHAFMNSLNMTISFAGGSIAALFIGSLSDLVGINNTFLYATILATFAIPFTFFLPKD
jgi:FSR family fosmidomycin resistance protein-like MFS transporter